MQKNKDLEQKKINLDKSNLISLEYLKGNFWGEEELLTETAAMEEYFFLGLRKIQGVDWSGYQEQYEEIVTRLVAKGLLEMEGKFIKLTELGLDVSNQVMAEFLVE